MFHSLRPAALAAALAAATFCLGGCGLLNDRPAARIASVRLADLSLQDATLEFDVDVFNPYDVPLPLADLDYALASGGDAFLSGRKAISGTVPARGTRTVSLPATVTFLKVLRAVEGVRPGQVLPYAAELGLSVRPPLGDPLRLPLRKEGKMPVPAPPGVAMPRVRWSRIGMDRAEGVATLALTNHNEFPLTVSALRYALGLAGTDVASAESSKGFRLAPGETGSLEIPISVSPRRLGTAFFRAVTGGRTGYELTGAAEAETPYGEMTIPLAAEGTTRLRAPGR
jgi:LEA14-like dessication related protein